MRFFRILGLLTFLMVAVFVDAIGSSLSDSLLLYASFDKYSDKADYANGWDKFGGGGYRLTKGYKGNAVDLRFKGLEKDFWKTENSYLPHLTQWLFWPRGNVNYRQGTLEFFFSGLGASEYELLGFLAHQPLTPQITDGKITKNYQPFVRISGSKLRWFLASLKGEHIQGSVDLTKIPGFKKITPDQWVHFAMQWSPDGFSIYLDGRLVKTQRLQDDGLALVSQPNRAVQMGGIILDELKIYDSPRYGKTFEPEWNGGIRPQNAFPGVEEETPLPNKKYIRNKPLQNTVAFKEQKTFKLKDWNITFDAKTGYISKIANGVFNMAAASNAAGLEVWQGVNRVPVLNPKISKEITESNGKLTFEQIWGKDLQVSNALTAGNNGEVYWDVEFANKGKQKLLLETLLGLPVSIQPTEFFDMSWVQTKLDIPRRRDEYVYSVPFVAISDGKNGLGVGLDPHFSVSALMGEWMPSKENQSSFIRQGTQVVLNQNEVQKLRFVLIKSSGAFGAKDALAAYQEIFPDLYKQKKNTSKYSYMPVAQHFRYVYTAELSRQLYIGNQWGHMPYHTKGDYIGRERFWGREDLKDDPSYKHAANSEKIYKTIPNMRNNYVNRNKESFDNYYTIMRTHDNPNSTATFIVREVMPGVAFKDDPLTAGQYYLPGFTYVNEEKTPLGDMLREDMVGMLKLAGKYSSGITNDLSQWTSYRFNDEYARKSAGRAFSADRGEYLVAAAGVTNRYKYMDSVLIGGKVRTMWSDYGGISYSTSAYSAANAIESGEWFYSLGGLQVGLEVGRNALGEKPMALLTSYGLDDIGTRFKITDFTPNTLRDYYRFGFRRIMLSAFQAGYYLDPMMLHGKLWNFETNPILIESMVNGRKTVSAVKVNEPLWSVRGGEDGNDIIVVGNSTINDKETSVEVINQYFKTKGSYIWAPYYGGASSQKISKTAAVINNVKINAHDVYAFKPVAELIGSEASEVRAAWEGDGLTINLLIDFNLAQSGQVKFVLPAAYYTVGAVKINGKTEQNVSNNIFSLPQGKSKVEVILNNNVLKFSSELWKETELIKNGKANFVLLNGAGAYEKGTANQFNIFLNQYDEEDGIEGNLAEAPLYDEESKIPASFEGWKIDTRVTSSGNIATSIVIDKNTKIIKINGKTPGEVRRAVMLFLRLLDRKYPHIGRFIPMGINQERGVKNISAEEAKESWKKIYNRRIKTREFFENFEDKDFLLKPILEKSSEALYADGNKNFEGKYTVRVSPYLFEPTYQDSFVYDYKD